MTRPLPPSVVVAIAGGVAVHGGRTLIVGGWVRDAYLGVESADCDVEVYGLTVLQIRMVLDSLELQYDVFGETFGIIKLKDHPIDISVPRRENRIGVKHVDFEIQLDPDMSAEEAALRRDFTMNSMYFDPLANETYDPYCGRADLKAGLLRMTNATTFQEDPLRVLRAMQFIARFGLIATPETKDTCKLMSQDDLSKERIFEEWKKLIVKGRRISNALNFLADVGWIGYYPELADLRGVEQDPGWHPEGDTWVHVLHCMDAFANYHLINNNQETWEYDRMVVGFGTLLHDVGKPSTTTHDEDGHIRALRHDKVGVDIAEQFMRRILPVDDSGHLAHQQLVDDVRGMVGEHMVTANFKGELTKRSVRRLSRRCASINLLCYVIQFDKEGRPPMTPKLEDVVLLRELADKYHVANDPPPPIMMGRHLIEMGFKPSRAFGLVLALCQTAEDDGEITNVETGKHFVNTLLAQQPELCAGLDSE